MPSFVSISIQLENTFFETKFSFCLSRSSKKLHPIEFDNRVTMLYVYHGGIIFKKRANEFNVNRDMTIIFDKIGTRLTEDDEKMMYNVIELLYNERSLEC